MKVISFKDQYRDPRWQKKRLEVMQKSDWQCDNCGAKEITLNVHHKRYIKGRMVWDYPDDLLSTLCEPCHEQHHQDRETLNHVLGGIEPASVRIISALAAGYLDSVLAIDPGTAEMARQDEPMFYELGMVAAAAECLGVEGWRKFVKEVYDKHPKSPTVKHKIEDWNAEEK